MTGPESSPSARQPLRALIVEDNPEDAELMVHELSRSGFEVTWKRVDNEADYLTQLEKPHEIVLADYALPQFGGSKESSKAGIRPCGRGFASRRATGSVSTDCQLKSLLVSI
jgi:CheY-like chemotaxis protein